MDPGLVSARVDGLASNCFLTTANTDTKEEVVRSFTTRVTFVIDCFPERAGCCIVSTANPAFACDPRPHCKNENCSQLKPAEL
jgi:hypothetical protein